MRYLKQSTSVDLPIGPFLDQTDGFTAETALTITQPDIRLKKNGGNWDQKNAAQTLTHEENGWYEVTLDATDTDTLGHLMLAVHESGALPVFHEFLVVPAAAYDALISGSGVGMRADIRGINGNADSPVILDRSARGITRGTVTTGATTSSIPTSSLDPAAVVADQWKGRVIQFDKDTTTAGLRGQARAIFSNTSGGTFTTEPFTTAPVSGDTFTVV